MPRWPDGIEVAIEREHSLQDLLLEGELDAIATAHPPSAFENADGTVRQLLDDPRAAAWHSWDRTAVFPIMHAVVVRRSVVDRAPWVGAHLFRAFGEARERSVSRAFDLTVSRYPVPFVQEVAAEARSRMGSIFPYGVAANAVTLNHFLDAAFEQGVTSRRVDIDELFHPGCEDGAVV